MTHDQDVTMYNVITMSSEFCRTEGCDVLVCIQPTISDGRLAPVLAQQWGKGEDREMSHVSLDLIIARDCVLG